jgi:hypothetical protein
MSNGKGNLQESRRSGTGREAERESEGNGEREHIGVCTTF